MLGGSTEVDIDGGYQMMNTAGVQDFVNIKAAPKLVSTGGLAAGLAAGHTAGQAKEARATEPLPDAEQREKVRQPPFR